MSALWCLVLCLVIIEGDIYLVRPAMVSSINILLLGLAMTDSLLILTSLLMVAIPSMHTHHTAVLDSRDRCGLEIQLLLETF